MSPQIRALARLPMACVLILAGSSRPAVLRHDSAIPFPSIHEFFVETEVSPWKRDIRRDSISCVDFDHFRSQVSLTFNLVLCLYLRCFFQGGRFRDGLGEPEPYHRADGPASQRRSSKDFVWIGSDRTVTSRI